MKTLGIGTRSRDSRALQVHTLLMSCTTHVKAREIAVSLQMTVTSVYTAIKDLRDNNIGIHAPNKGYILSSFASKQDDVGFMKRLWGRRIADMRALQPAKSDIQRRWSSVEDQSTLLHILGPLDMEKRALDEGVKAVLTQVNSLGL